MNPALLNYLQANQQHQDQSSLIDDIVGEQLPDQQIAANNPFDSGIRRAIDTARESLGMTEKQQERALRRGLLNFAANIGQTPREKGFFANFGAASRAAIPAMNEYDNAEIQANAENNVLANQILNYQKAQRHEDFEREKFTRLEELNKERLAEQQRYHDMKSAEQEAKLQAQNTTSPLGEDFIPLESKSERLMYSKDKKAAGELLSELQSIEKDYNELKSLTENDMVGPMTPYGIGKTANSAKDFFGYFTGDKASRNNTVKRKALEAKLGKFQAELERKLKGGMLTKGMIELFENKDLLPSINNAPDIFEAKMDNLMHEMQERYDASDASLRYNTHISPYDLEVLKQRDSAQATPTEATNIIEETPDQFDEFVKVQGPSGRIEEVHIDDIAKLDPTRYKRL